MLHLIESVVIEWSHQIDQVLKRKPNGVTTTATPVPASVLPSHELRFWKERLDNLQCIHQQLSTGKVKAMGEALESVGSSYYPTFQDTIEQLNRGKYKSSVSSAWTEVPTTKVTTILIYNFIYLTALNIVNS